jgi:hypothetical protein
MVPRVPVVVAPVVVVVVAAALVVQAAVVVAARAQAASKYKKGEFAGMAACVYREEHCLAGREIA